MTNSDTRNVDIAANADSVTEALALVTDGISISSTEGLICYANPAFERMFGYEPNELAGSHVSVLNAYSSEENERIVRAVLDELAQTDGWSGEWVNRRKDGTVFITSSDIRAIDWRGSRHLLCVQRTRSASADTRPATSVEEERLVIATEAASLGVWEWDLSSNTFVYSDRARTICGFPPTGPIHYDDVVRVTHPSDLPDTLAKAKRALDPEIRERTPYEYRIIRTDGVIRWVRAYGYAVFSSGVQPLQPQRYVGTLEDITDRVEAREREHEAARQVHLALESARMAVWSVDFKTKALKSSPEFNQLFGFSSDATPTLEDVEARHAPGEVDAMRQRWLLAAEQREQSFESEFRILRNDEERWLRVRSDIRYFENGQPDRAIGVIMDVTEQKRAADALSESDTRFREAADSAPAPVWMTNSEGKVEFGNQAMAEFAGLSVDQVMGDVWLSRLHPDDLAGVAVTRAKAWAEGHVPYTIEARFRRADGEWRWLEVSSRARRDAAGQFKGYVGLAVDRTEAHLAMSTLAESEERFRLLADSAPVMIWMSNSDGACSYLNAALREFWDVTEEGLNAFDWRTMMHPEDEAAITSSVVQATLDQVPFSVQGRYSDANGNTRIIRTDGVPRFASSGQFLGMIGVNIDLTDLLEARDRQQVLLEELNHRVKNTLAVVQSLAKQTFRAGSDVDVARRVFEARLQALAGAHTLLTQSQWENATLAAICEQAVLVCGEARNRIARSGTDLVLSPKQALTIALALHELCTNALRHGALRTDAGAISLTWEALNRRIELRWEERSEHLVSAPGVKGFGSTLLERVLPRDVSGEGAIEFDPRGVRYQLAFPMDLK